MIQKTMNKAENVPIATLSGIASLTEITPELPLPSSTCTSRDIQLFRSEDDATESIKLVADSSHSQQQIESFEKLLCSVNNAYLDFKNSINNRPCVFTDIPHLPPIIQHVTINKPDVFQPHFDTYHGSPLKTNNVSALAYSPNQRNTFIMHQQQQHLQQKQPPAPGVQESPTSLSSSSPKVPPNHKDNSEHKIIVADEAPPFSPLTNNPDGVIQNTTKTQSNDVVCSQDNDKKNVNGQCTDEMDLSIFVPAEIVSHNELNEMELRLHKKRKKKHKQKRKRVGSTDENNELSNKGTSPNNEIDNQKLTLRIPKLIVRKVKQIEDDNEVEILEISRKDKDKGKLKIEEDKGTNELDIKEELHSSIQNTQNETRTVNEAELLKSPLPRESDVPLELDEKQNETGKQKKTAGTEEMETASISIVDEKQNDINIISEDNSLKEKKTASVVEQKQTGTNVIDQDIPLTPSKNKPNHNLSPVSVVVSKLEDDIIEKNLKKSGKTESPVTCAETALQSKKRLRNEASSVSSEEQTLQQVQKRKREAKIETLDPEPMETETIVKACKRSGKQRKTHTSKQSQQESSDDEVLIIKSRGKLGKQKTTHSTRQSQQESSSEDEVLAVSAAAKRKEEQSASTSCVTHKESSGEESIAKEKPKCTQSGKQKQRNCRSIEVNHGFMENEPGCSSGSNVRRGRKKPVNYKEAKSESENDDSEDSEKPVKLKARKRKSRNMRQGSSDSDEDFNPTTEETRATRGGRRSRNVRTPSPDDRDQADWTTPALDPYWDEESEEDNEEMESLNREIVAQGVKTDVKKFMFLMEKIFEHELEMEADGDLDINEDIEIPPESLISKPLISALCTEAAKMKSSGKLCEMPADQLVRTIAIMDRHVKDSIHLTPTRDEEEGEESRKWYSLQIDRVVRSAESAAVILHITTSPDMPKQVFLEEAIERVVLLCQFQLENTIFPAFDPIYNVAGDGDCITKKSRRYNRSAGARSKYIQKVYNKFCEVVSLLANLLTQGTLTDSIILKMSQIGISPFFVEHVSILQLESLKVSRAIFRTYLKHRDLILEDILASLSRLPSSKRNLRTYRLNGNDVIQMFTALVLQLIQCTVQVQTTKEKNDSQNESTADKDVLIVRSYEDALRAARNFLSVFLKKCSSRDENDFRPLFENFLHDLFTTANLPEWPASEVLLTQLGHLFVVTFSNTKLEMNLRTTALDYLSQIATHLRKAALRSGADGVQEDLKSIVERLLNMKDNEEEVPVTDDMEVYDGKLRKALLHFLLSSSDSDLSFKYAREFYLGQWIRDIQMEIEKSIMAPIRSIPGAAGKTGKEEKEERKKTKEAADKLVVLQEKKKFYHILIDDTTVSTLKSFQPLNYESACTTIDHLASSRSFSLSFDLYMQQIFKMLSEQAIALRTKAVKALTMIVSVDPNILARDDVQASVHGRLLDPSTNVREAAVDLIGQFVLKCPNLIKQYYEMIIARILDTGVSVRKRVIKILRDICIEHPDFEKIPEICAKMIRRIEDESGIKKLVTEVFRAMWFQPVKTKESEELYQKAVNITKVISLCKETGFDWLESLLNSLFDTTESQASSNVAITACQQLVDCLVTRLLKPELKCETNTVVSCLITLHLFCKAQPTLLIHHAATLQPYLSSKIETPTDSLIIQHVSKILEIVVPLMEHPSPKFLADLEEDSMKLMLKQSQNVVQSCASCLAAIINNVTHNYKFIVDGFTHFYKFLIYYKCEHIKDPANNSLQAKRPTLLRALFTIGLFCRHFDLDQHVPDEEDIIEEKKKDEARSEQVFDLCMYFTDFADEMITLKAILAIGFIGVRYPQLLLKDACRNLYQEILSPFSTSTNAKFTILKSLQNHLIEEELRLQQAEKGPGSKVKRAKKEEDVEKEDIKEMGDSLSGTTSEIIQVLLRDIMKGFFHSEKQVRISALQVIAIILRQGLIHPAQCIPFLVAISTDTERLCQVKAEQCLNDLDSRYQGFIHMKAFQGVKMSYDIQFVIQKADGGYICAYRENENKIALINHVYGLIRSNKQYRRPFLLSILKQTDDIRSPCDLKYYLAENLAYIGYSTHEEPLFILYHIDKKASVSGANILQKFKELFHPSAKNVNGNADESSSDSDDSDDEDVPLIGCKGNEEELRKIVRHSFGCMLMLELKKYLKAIYGFTDSKCQKYSPLEPSKLYERPLNRKCDLDFVSEYKDFMFSDLEYDKAVKYYLKFKGMMMELDQEQDDSDSDMDEKTDIKKKENEDANTTNVSTDEVASMEVSSTINTTTTTTTSTRRMTRNKEASPAKPETPVTSTSRSSRNKDIAKNSNCNTPGSNFKWSIEMKIQLVELAREAKLQSSRGYASRLKTRWDEEVPKCKWMSQDLLRENAEQFEEEEIIGKRESRRSSRRSTR